MELPAAVTDFLDQSIQFIYSFEPLVAPTVVLGALTVFFTEDLGWLSHYLTRRHVIPSPPHSSIFCY